MSVTYQNALAEYQSGSRGEAERICLELIAERTADAECYNLLGVLQLERSDPESALRSFTDGLTRQPTHALMLNNLGNALRQLSFQDQAETAYRQAASINPALLAPWLGLCGLFAEQQRSAEARHLLDQLLPIAGQNHDLMLVEAIVLASEGDAARATAVLKRLIQLAPGMLAARVKLGELLLAAKDPVGSHALFEGVVRQQPLNEPALNGLAESLDLMGRPGEALPFTERAAALAPDNPKIRYIQATAADRAGRPDLAETAFAALLAMRPDDTDLRISCGEHAFKMGRLSDAARLYEDALSINPSLAKPRLLLCAQQLPVAYRTEAEIDERRAAFERRLEELESWVATADRDSRARLADILGDGMPFLLAAQGRNDRDLLARFGALASGLLSGEAPPPEPPSGQGPIRLGIVSGFFRQHAVWKIALQGFITRLDPARVQLFCYATGIETDAETDIARACAARFVQGRSPRDRWIREIQSDRLDALLYPDYYMDRTTALLAPQRLVPVQIAIGIHPVTTGLPTIDYHLSSDGMEPPDAQAHYTETLVRLPNLANCYSFPRFARQPVTRVEIGVPDAAVMYWCGQSLHKLLPRDDELFAQIARRVPDAFFVFIEHAPGHAANEIVRARLRAAFGDGPPRFVMLPKMPMGRFQAVTELADVFLDATAWSGNNTAMESLAAGLPIVTLPGSLMRARHAFAILTMMGVTDTVAATREEYVELAVRLGLDPVWRTEIRQEMVDNRHKVLDDQSCVRALEDFLESVCR